MLLSENTVLGRADAVPTTASATTVPTSTSFIAAVPVRRTTAPMPNTFFSVRRSG